MTRMEEGAYHIPVLLKDCTDALHVRPDGIYVDATFGGGGHAREIFKRLSSGRLYAFDVDPDAVKNAIGDARFTLIQENFSRLKKSLLDHGVAQVDGLLADLGVSSHQFDTEERGFSTRFDSALDMRMDKKGRLTAAEVLRSYSNDELAMVFRKYGEIRNAKQVAARVTVQRDKIRTVNDLKSAIAVCAEKGRENQFYAKVFQALRIEVNDELNALKEMLMQSVQILKPGGRIAVISYHSLEDRLVKNFFRSGKFEGEPERDIFGNVLAPIKAVNKKPITPDMSEIEWNSRARSAKLRIGERITMEMD